MSGARARVRRAVAGLGRPAGFGARLAVSALDVIVDGRPVTVPAGIGVDQRAHLIAALFTTDASGIIHVTSDSQQQVFTLGQFFAEWQVALAPGRLGGLRVARREPVEVYLDGSRVAGGPGSLVLGPHQEIVVAYRAGSAAIPVSYASPAGI